MHIADEAAQSGLSVSAEKEVPEAEAGLGRPAAAAEAAAGAAELELEAGVGAAGTLEHMHPAATAAAPGSTEPASTSSPCIDAAAIDTSSAGSVQHLEPAAAGSASSSMQGESPQPTASTAHTPPAAAQPAADASSSAAGDEEPGPSNGSQRVSYYRWAKPRRLSDRPGFLYELPVPDGQSPNVFSFLGVKDPHEGKFYVHPMDYTQFLSDYFVAFRSGYRLFLAEKYFHYPFRYFAELDFSWELDRAVVEGVTHKVIDILSHTVQRFYRTQLPPSYLVSMRTPYKVHINFPWVITTERMAHMCRDQVVAQCKEQLGGSYPLDWERIVDFPHGSFRILGSCKARHMDTDPAWVLDKAYYPVTWDEQQRVWQPYGISHRLLCQTSIFPQPYQLKEFEGSALFLDMSYQDVDAYRVKIEERRLRRQEQRAAQGPAPPKGPAPASGTPGGPPPPRQGMCAVRLHVQEDGSARVAFRLRKWAQKLGRQLPQAEEAEDCTTDAS